MFRASLFFIILFTVSGCSTLVQKVAVGQTSNLLLNASDELWYETDLRVVEQGTPGLIKLIEGLHHVEPKTNQRTTRSVLGRFDCLSRYPLCGKVVRWSPRLMLFQISSHRL